jgi:hypothetical protein
MKLLNALHDLARTDTVEEAMVAPEAMPVLSEEARDRIARAVLALRTRTLNAVTSDLGAKDTRAAAGVPSLRLALPHLPDAVVFSAGRAAFERGSADEPPRSNVMSLAQAFLADGSHAVVAPIRDVDNFAARTCVASLYRSLDSPESLSLEQAFRRAAEPTAGANSQGFRL